MMVVYHWWVDDCSVQENESYGLTGKFSQDEGSDVFINGVGFKALGFACS
jgi:hypothetical protein